MLWFTEAHFKELLKELHTFSHGIERMTSFADRIAGDVTRIARDVQSIGDQLKAAAQTGGDLTPALDKLDSVVDTLDQLAGVTKGSDAVAGTIAPPNPPTEPGSGATLPPSTLTPATQPATSGSAPTPGTTIAGAPVAPSSGVSSVQVSPTSLSLKVGESGQLNVAILGADGNTAQGVSPSFDSSDASAQVNNQGVVTGISAGTSTITVSCEGQSASVSVTVTA